MLDPFIDEVLRMSGVVKTVRLVTPDCILGEAQPTTGDMVLCSLALAGLDERINTDPVDVRIHRKGASHLMFATGPHLCVGHFLARLELRVLLQEWLNAIPDFALDPTWPRDVRFGTMTAVLQVGLCWH